MNELGRWAVAAEASDGLESLRDITGLDKIGESPPAEFPAQAVLLTVIGAAVVALVGVIYWRLTARARGTPRRRTQSRLDRLISRRLAGKGHGKLFANLLNKIVRDHLVRLHDLPARRRTTTEVLQSMADGPMIDPALHETVADFLRRCDRIRFSQAEPSSDDCESIVRKAREIIGFHASGD